MKVNVHLGAREKEIRRVAMKVAACMLLVIGFLLVASATFSPLLATSLNSALAHASTPSGSKMPSLSSTPLPRSQSGPRVVAGQPGVDANTVALYHFDSDASDATGKHNGTLNGNTTITNLGVYSGAAQFDGNGSYVRTGDLGNFTSGTIEAFVDFAPACQAYGSFFTIISAGPEYGGGGPTLVLEANVGLVFGIYHDGQWTFANSGINPCRYLAGQSASVWPYETWRFHHVAGTWGPRGVEIWVDGILHGVGNNDSNNPYNYMCNPQMQLGVVDPANNWYYPPNPLYPVCQTPVMAPTMPAYPPGDYVGRLPAYSTFLIGCRSDGGLSCYTGRIDEVRISSVQRTFAAAVVPTSTPIPTSTPVSINSPYSGGSLTAALYHLNYASQTGAMSLVYNEVNGQYDASYWGNAAVVSNGRFNSGLAIYGDVTIDGFWPQLTMNPGNLGSGTLETWMNLSNPSGHLTVFRGSSNEAGGLQPRMLLGIHSPGGNIGFGIDNGNYSWAWADSNAIPQDFVGSWHHIAGTWGARGLELWIDGQLCSSYSYYGSAVAPIAQYGVGCDATGHCMRGTIDEVRVSTIQRTFAPLGHMPVQSSAPTAPFASRQGATTDFGPYIQFLPFIGVVPTPVRVPCSPK